MTKIYRTMKSARGALALDTGYDPFRVHHIRCTKATLAEYGYSVDPAEVARREREQDHRCATCQEPIERQEYDGLKYYWPTHCPEHTIYGYECDYGHRWRATDAQDHAADHRGPCGHYWV